MPTLAPTTWIKLTTLAECTGWGLSTLRRAIDAKALYGIQSHGAWLTTQEAYNEWIHAGQGRGNSRDGEARQTPGAVYRSFRRIASGTRFADVEMHDLRRTFGMDMLESGVDLRTAAEQMRHDPAMLANIYSRSRRDLKRAAAAKVFGGNE